MTLRVEKMEAGHWEGVRAVYVEGLATGEATFETRAPERARWDASHLPCCRLVALDGGRVAGWAALSPVSARVVYSGVAEVSVYVGSDFRGRGVGRD
jgi:phosphinothricin acetyltransferase